MVDTCVCIELEEEQMPPEEAWTWYKLRLGDAPTSQLLLQ